MRSIIFVAVSLLLGTLIGCGPGTTQLRPAVNCDGGNLKDCKTRCAQNEARACYRLGWFYEQGQNRPESVAKALKLYAQACEAKMAIACRALGVIYARGKKVQRSGKKAADYNAKACALGLELACLTPAEKKRLAAMKAAGGSGSVKAEVNFKLSTGD